MTIQTNIVEIYWPIHAFRVDTGYLAENKEGIEWATMGKTFATLIEAEAAVAGIKALAWIAPDVKWSYKQDKWIDE